MRAALPAHSEEKPFRRNGGWFLPTHRISQSNLLKAVLNADTVTITLLPVLVSELVLPKTFAVGQSKM